MWNNTKYEVLSSSSSRLGQLAGWGVWAQTILMARPYQKQEHSWESEPASSGETMALPGNLNFCFKYLALGHVVIVTNDSGAPGMKAACDSPLQVKWAVSLFTASAPLKPFAAWKWAKALWSLSPKHCLACNFPPTGYFPSLHLQLLSPWHKHLFYQCQLQAASVPARSLCLSLAATQSLSSLPCFALNASLLDFLGTCALRSELILFERLRLGKVAVGPSDVWKIR